MDLIFYLIFLSSFISSIHLFIIGKETTSILLDQSACPLGWEPADVLCVKSFFQPMTTDEAKTECQANGAELVNIILNQQENKELINDLSDIINKPLSEGVAELTWIVGGIEQVLNDAQLSYNLWLSTKSEEKHDKSLALQKKNNKNFELVTVSSISSYPFICSLLPLTRKMLLYEQSLYPKGAPKIIEEPKLAYHYSARPEGYFVTLPCKAVGNPTPKIRWYKSGIEEVDVESSNSSYIISGGSLLIPIDKDFTESVEYHCTANNKYGTYRSSSTIVRSAFIEPFRNNRLDAYANRKGPGTRIECQTPQHYPKSYSFSWMKSGKTDQFVTQSERTFVSMDGTLFFSYNKKEDSTTYACSLNLPSIQSGHYGPFFKLILPGAIPGPSSAPKIDEYQPQIFPEIPTRNQPVYIECFAYGFPTPKYKWTRIDGKPLSSRHRILNYGRVLKIDSVTVDDAVRYKCIATNELGLDSAEIQLVVHSPPTILRPMIDNLVATNTTAKFDCEIANNNNAQLTIEWFHDGQPLTPLLMPPADRKRFKIHDNTLTILNALSSDSGIYQCIASNEIGSTSTSARLTVEDSPPVFHGNIFPRRIFVVQGSKFILPCFYLASPRGFAQWYTSSSPDTITSDSSAHVRQRKEHISGDDTIAMLEIENVQKSDEGIYNCETINGVGEGRGSVQLNVVEKPTIVVKPQTIVNTFPAVISKNPRKITCEVELACERLEDCPEALFDWQFNDRKIRSIVTRSIPLKTTAYEKNIDDSWKDKDMRSSRWIFSTEQPLKQRKNKKNKKIRQVSQLEVSSSFASSNIGRFACNSIYGTGTSEIPESKIVGASPTQFKVVEVRNTQVKLSWKQPANQKRRGFGNNVRMEGYQIEYRTDDNRQWRTLPLGIFKTQDRIVGSYTVRDLHPNQNYQFRVRTRAVDGSLSAPSTHSDWIQTPQSPPLDPINVIHWRTLDDTHLLVEWDPVEADHTSGPNLRYNVSWSDPTQTLPLIPKNIVDTFTHTAIVTEPSIVISLKGGKQKKKKIKKKGKNKPNDSCYTIAVGVQPINDVGTGPSSTDTVVHISSEGPKRYADNLIAIPINSTHIKLSWEWKNLGECENVIGAQIKCIETKKLIKHKKITRFAVNHSMEDENNFSATVWKESSLANEIDPSIIQINQSVPAHYSFWLVHSLRPSTEYTCTVQAFDQYGRYGNISENSAYAKTYDPSPPIAPEIKRVKLQEQENGYTTLIEWTAIPLRNSIYNNVTDNERGYKIFIYVSETAEHPITLTITEAELQNPKKPSAKIDGLKLMYFYKIKIAGFNEGGTGPLSKGTSVRLGMSGDISSVSRYTFSYWIVSFIILCKSLY